MVRWNVPVSLLCPVMGAGCLIEFHVDVRKMSVTGCQAAAVIHDDELSVAVLPAHE